MIGRAIEWYRNRRAKQRALKESRLLLREARRALRRYRHRMTDKVQTFVRAAIDRVAAAQKEGPHSELLNATNALDKALDDHLSFARKSTFREYTESIGVAVLIALFLRAFVVEAFKIPSGSMIPTLQVGDHIFVNKFIYGIRIPWTNIKFGTEYRKPRRGEVIVFVYPKEPEKDFIKRIVAIEGDTVEVRENQLYVNGTQVARARIAGDCQYQDFDELASRWEERHCAEKFMETLDGVKFETIYDRGDGPRGPWTVPAHSVFVMGDNRNNSHDSRYWGFVPFDHIKGKAMVIWLSAGQIDAEDPPVINWFKSLRYGRMFNLVK